MRIKTKDWFILGSFLVVLFPSISFADLTTNLVATYSYNGNLNDSSSNAFNLTNTGTTQVTGIVDFARNITNAGPYYMSHAYNSSLNLTSTDFSIGVWVNFNTVADACFAAMNDENHSNGPAYTFYYTGNSIDLYLNGSVIDGGGKNVSVSWTPSTGTWYNIVVTYNKTTGATKFYLNGSQQGTTQTQVTGGIRSVSAYSPDFLIGQSDYRYHAYTTRDANFDITTLWNKELSSTDVTTFYNSGAGLEYPFSLVHPSPIPPMIIFWNWY